jgi:hypothetical protein
MGDLGRSCGRMGRNYIFGERTGVRHGHGDLYVLMIKPENLLMAKRMMRVRSDYLKPTSKSIPT